MTFPPVNRQGKAVGAALLLPFVKCHCAEGRERTPVYYFIVSVEQKEITPKGSHVPYVFLTLFAKVALKKYQ